MNHLAKQAARSFNELTSIFEIEKAEVSTVTVNGRNGIFPPVLQYFSTTKFNLYDHSEKQSYGNMPFDL